MVDAPIVAESARVHGNVTLQVDSLIASWLVMAVQQLHGKHCALALQVLKLK
jgi:hypothetical protein